VLSGDGALSPFSADHANTTPAFAARVDDDPGLKAGWELAAASGGGASSDFSFREHKP
jgi:hypothetical protein